MSNSESPDDLKRVYRAAPVDEPPAALDAAILALARREAGSPRPAAKSGARTWGPPLAIAAVLVLTVSLVVVMDRERPDVSTNVASNVSEVAGIAPPARELALAPAAKHKADEGSVAAAPPAAFRESAVQDGKPRAAQPARDHIAGAAATVASSEANPARGMALRASPAAESAVSGGTAPAEESPEAWLRRLAELKQQGRLREFQQSLAEFRKRHPAYPVPETLVPAQ